jgi:heme/copper-type cytochrome/quinol oxidase subunit 2
MLILALLMRQRSKVMKRNTIMIIVLAVLALALVFAAASFWVDFRAAQGNTRSESQVSAFSTQTEGDTFPPVIHQLTVYVDEPGYLMDSVRQGLVKGIQDRHAIPDLRVVNEMPVTTDGPVLMVEVTPQRFVWLGVYTTSDLQVKMTYAYDGDLSWKDALPVIMPPGTNIRLRGEYEVTDTSFGLMTLRGQARYLGRQVAGELIQSIDAHLY